MSKEKIGAVVGLVLVLGGVGYYSFFGKTKTGDLMVAKVESVAKVNGVDITKSAFDAQLASVITSLKSQGTDTENPDKLLEIKTQILNDLISNELLIQGSKEAGVTVTAEDIEKQFQVLVTQVGGADKLKEELVKANLTETQLRENISKQLVIQKYLLSKIDISTAVASDAEISKFYDDNVKGKDGAPTLKDISEQIKQQIISTKQQALVNAFVASLREKAKVETFL